MKSKIDTWLRATRQQKGVSIPNFPSEPDVDIVNVQYINTRQNTDFYNTYRPEEHRHSFFEIHLMLTGQQTYHLQDAYYPLENSAMLLIPPYLSHTIPNCTTSFSKFHFSFCRSAEKNADFDWIWNALSVTHPLYVQDAQDFRALFTLLFDLLSARRRDFLENVRRLVSVLVIMLAEELKPAFLNQQVSEATQRAGMLKQFINDHLDFPMDVSLLSSHLHVSPRQLTRDVRNDFGMTPLKLIEKIKYENACQMLSETDQTISSIALALGFMYESTFRRLFKRRSGLTPNQWRKVHKAKQLGSKT